MAGLVEDRRRDAGDMSVAGGLPLIRSAGAFVVSPARSAELLAVP